MSAANGDKRALHVATQSGWYRFERRGEDWQSVEGALTYWSLTCLAVDPVDPHVVFAGSERSGLFVTDDGGATWKRAEPRLPHLALTSLLALPGALMVGTVPAALYRGNPGKGWEEIEGVRRACGAACFPPNPELGARTRYLAADPAVSSRLYAGIEVGGLLVSDDAGVSWRPANEGLSDPDVHQLQPCSRTPELVVAACGEGLFRSLDRSEHWQEVTPPGARAYGTAVTEAADGSVYVAVARGRPNTWLKPERADAAVLRSRNSASGWEPVVQGLRGGVLDLCPDPDGKGILAATSEGEVLAIDGPTSRPVVSGLPCINALALGA